MKILNEVLAAVEANNKHPNYVDLGLKNITFCILAGCARRGLVGPSAHPDIHYRAMEAFHQVWSLSQFFYLLFVCLEGKSKL